MRISLLFSVAVNLLLITTFVAARVDQNRGGAHLDSPVLAGAEPIRWYEQPDSLENLALRPPGAGLSERLIKHLAVSWLITVESGRAPIYEHGYRLAESFPASGQCAGSEPGRETGSREPERGDATLTTLGKPARDAYLLRFSPLAAQIRERRVASEEAELRRSLELMHALEKTGLPAEHLELHRALRAALGNRDIDRRRSPPDPDHHELERHVRASGIPAREVAAAYGVVDHAQNLLRDVLGRELGQTDAADAAAERRRELAEWGSVLGQPAAERLLAKQAELAIRRSLGEALMC